MLWPLAVVPQTVIFNTEKFYQIISVSAVFQSVLVQNGNLLLFSPHYPHFAETLEQCEEVEPAKAPERTIKKQKPPFPWEEEEEILPSAEIGFPVCYVSLKPAGNTRA